MPDIDIDAVVAELPDEIVNYIGELQDEVTSLTKSLDEANESAPVEDDGLDPIEKALGDLDDDGAKAIREKLELLDSLEQTIVAGAIEKSDMTYIEKARAFDGFADPDVLGPALRRLAAGNPDDVAVVEEAFAKAAAQTNVTTLYDELGTTIAKSGDAESQIDQIAKSLVTVDPNLTIEEARAEAWERNPELYAEHRVEQFNATQRH